MRSMNRYPFIILVVLCVVIASVSIVPAITNGQPDGNRHPYVGLIVLDTMDTQAAIICSGSLLSDTVILTAGHCTVAAVAARAYFASDAFSVPGFPLSGETATGVPYTHPDWSMTNLGIGANAVLHNDVGVVVLDKPVTGLGNVQLPELGLTESLPPMAPLEVVGYGFQRTEHGWRNLEVFWSGLRMYAPSALIPSEQANYDMIRLTENPAQGKGGICFGDSGGPNLIAGTQITIGVNTMVTNMGCHGDSQSQRLDTESVLDWVQSFLE